MRLVNNIRTIEDFTPLRIGNAHGTIAFRWWKHPQKWAFWM